MSKKDPAFLFYPGDFIIGSSDLTFEEKGQYITLLCLQHQKGHLPEKTIRLSVGNASVDVLNKFSIDKNGNYFNERLDIEIEKRVSFVESRRNNGALGGRPKKPTGEPTGSHKGNLSVSVNEDIIINEFEEWWGLYSKPVGKKKSFAKFLKLKQPDRGQCLEVVEEYVKSTPDKQFRKDPLTYLNGEHWNDEIIQDNKSKPSRPQFKTATGGGYVAYCSKCHQVQFPKDKWAIEAGSTCHGADFLNEKPKAK